MKCDKNKVCMCVCVCMSGYVCDAKQAPIVEQGWQHPQSGVDKSLA